MALIAPRQAQRPIPPEGTHVARVTRIIHIGTIPDTYQGEEKESNKVDITWELLDETYVFKEGEDAKPFVVSQEYTLSMGEKANLRKIVEGMIGKKLQQDDADSFDITSLINQPCLLVVQHKTSKTSGNIYPVVVSASQLMKGQVAKEAFNSTEVLTYGDWSEEYFQSLPDFIKEKMMSSKEYKAMKSYNPDGINPDDIPF